MKFSASANILAGLGFLLMVGCGSSDSGSSPESTVNTKQIASVGNPIEIEPSSVPQDKDLQEYLKVIDHQMTELKNSHAELVSAAPHRNSDPSNRKAWETSLDDLTHKSQEVEKQVHALKKAKEREWVTLQPGLNHALKELTESYEQALAQVDG